MKFNCGLTAYEELELAHQQCSMLNSKESEWVRIFAWLPVRVAKNDCRWLEYVEKQESYYRVVITFFGSKWKPKPRDIKYREVQK